MAKQLPRSPRIEFIKKEAKTLLKQQKRRDPDCLRSLRNLERFTLASENEIYNDNLNLSQVQFAVALDYGFKSWIKLEDHIRNKAQFPDQDPQDLIGPISPQIIWTPPGKPLWHKGWMNGHIRGIELILNYLSIEVDYDTLMGDSGQAFIMQGEEGSQNLIRGKVDIGWWPLELLSFARLNFVEDTTGIEIIDLIADIEEYKNHPQDLYENEFHTIILDCLSKNRPCIAARIDNADFILTGCDDERYPLIGACTNSLPEEIIIDRIKAPVPPYGLITFGEEKEKMERVEADKAALEFAIALHQDETFSSYSNKYSLRHIDRFQSTWRTGKLSFKSWMNELADNNPGDNYWHGNVKSFLINNRNSALRYLKKMNERHDNEVSSQIDEAIKYYRQVVEIAEFIDTSDQSFYTITGRTGIIERIEMILKTETSAIESLQEAVRLLG